ncbi:NUDIX hydrolase [Stygiolobus caldivivus]|uniref:Coenzyme A pyrophosphatase n=1 Tax=Stygiolobus caldivivus TaxID=2824673 RepID=A0A8D5U819_9CREN|nr:CoA pyrophosphatase [Stygiolobus caldivivus]BCU70464.1 coenzyme A pyrophosphatase [Stygiolobus caldivivus]
MECKAAVTVIVSKNGYILLIKRKQNPRDPWSGHVAFPGGRRENSESCYEAAMRECYEEVGIRPKIVKELGTYFPNNAPDMKVKAFLGCVEREFEPVIQKDEVDKAIWIRPQDLEVNQESFYYGDLKIWGMTYRILKDVIEKKLYQICLGH